MIRRTPSCLLAGNPGVRVQMYGFIYNEKKKKNVYLVVIKSLKVGLELVATIRSVFVFIIIRKWILVVN